MRFFVIGLGSMGKRRVRCLLELGYRPDEIYGFDNRGDRRVETVNRYGIRVIDTMEGFNFRSVDAFIVSLPPDKHKIGVDIAVKYQKPVFVEASVILSETELIREVGKDIFIAPSCTFVFHPMIKEIKRIVNSEKYGKVCNFSYHSGQYLPDWHPWEDVKDFYVSNRLTGGAREIVPYELTWITDTFGMPDQIKGFYRKTMDIGCDIEDSYASVLSYGDMIGTLLVDVVSRYPARNLIINMEKGQIQWRWDEEKIRIYSAETGETSFIEQANQMHEEGYSSMIGEAMYIEEIRAFLSGIESADSFPNTIEKDIRVLGLLNQIEVSDGGFDRE